MEEPDPEIPATEDTLTTAADLAAEVIEQQLESRNGLWH